MIEILRKFENRAIKILRDYSILITKIYQFRVIYFNFVMCCGVSCDVDVIKQTASAQFINREVRGYINYCFKLFMIMLINNYGVKMKHFINIFCKQKHTRDDDLNI